MLLPLSSRMMLVASEVILDAATDECILCRGPLPNIGENAASSEAAAG